MTAARPSRVELLLERSIPLWAVLLCLLLCGLVMVAFGWAVKSTLSGSDRSGKLGRIAVAIASFPGTTKEAFGEVKDYVSGDYKAESVQVEQQEVRDYSGFQPISSAPGIDVQGLLVRADPSAITDGWRLLVGAFALDGDARNAALLLSPSLEVVKRWDLEETAIDGLEPKSKYRKFVHGLAVVDDGSLIFAFDNGVSLQRIDWCGRPQWAIGGEYNHSVTLDDTGQSVWTLSSTTTVAQVSVENGKIIRSFSMDDVIAANPMIDILEVRRKYENDVRVNSRRAEGTWMADPFHLNDVDPLPAAIADRFDGFNAGDLLISARSLNLLFVVDPDTLHVKWWSSGAVQRQHDPDWLPDGRISVLNNRMSREFSEIASIDPATNERATILDGRKNDFYTRIRGKQQTLPDGHLLVTSTQQGRAFEVDGEGNVVLEIVNVKAGSKTTNYAISEMQWLPPGSFDPGEKPCALTN